MILGLTTHNSSGARGIWFIGELGLEKEDQETF